MTIRPNSPHAWWLAARPKTLSAALIPVVTATALATTQGHFAPIPAALCFVFAALMQVAANFINDLYDFLRGTDGEDRLGPERACAQRWITPRAMKWGIAVVVTAACTAGLALVPYGGWQLVAVGAACVVFAFLYSLLLSYCGLGDVVVWLFFGFVPVLGTYYVQAGTLCAEAWWLAAAAGLAADTLLVLNNYRDRYTDRRSGKRTIVVVLGERFGSYFYLYQGIAAYLCGVVLALYDHPLVSCFTIPYLVFHQQTYRTMVTIHSGRALNRVLGFTSRNMLIFALGVALALLLE